MIARLTGTLAETTADSAVLDVAGVGYQVLASARTLDAIGPIGGTVMLLTEMQVREDSMTLFAFATAGERESFRHLTSVQGVGGRVALAILSVLDPAELTFDFATPSLFEDAESGRTLYVDPAAARTGYLTRFQAHQEALAALCRKLGAAFHVLSTARPLEQALTDFFQDRLKRGRLVRRGAR